MWTIVYLLLAITCFSVSILVLRYWRYVLYLNGEEARRLRREGRGDWINWFYGDRH